MVDLNYPPKFITWVSGSFSTSTPTLKSITFGTNQGTYGPFGVRSKKRERRGNQEMRTKINAVGYPNNGNAWDDVGKAEIIQIFISHGTTIGFIQFMYVENEKVVSSRRIGGTSGNRLDTIDFNYPSEFLTWVSGSFYDSYSYALASITFGTNQGTYGPFGVNSNKKEKEFCFRMGDRRTFAGFHGTHSTSGIHSFGVYIKPVNTVLKPGPSLQIKEENNQN
ncbi:hypothetical protein HHK36_020261 [Tetracentron sinense]|uniref:Jacalin-type lectin domain-containing protein n=1 Tax=Tetracentron sinense TaxID=13715 RepID=A0A834YRB1_TETSI|nr:hypothetical protein HHK36_020261 [Tetracentron sinense]